MVRKALHCAAFHVFLAVAVALSPAAALAQQPAPPDLSYATERAFVGVVGRPKRVLAAPEMAMMPYEVVQAAGQQELGFDPLTIEEAQIFVEPPMLGPPQFLAVLRFAEAFDLGQLKEGMTRHTEREELDGRPYLRSTMPIGPSLFAADDRTLLIGNDEMLRRAYAARADEADSTLISRLKQMEGGRDLYAAIEVAPIRPLLVAQLHQAPPFPPPLDRLEATVKSSPDLIEAIETSLGLTGGADAAGFSLVVRATDEAAAEELEGLIEDGIALWQEQMLAAFEQAEQSDDAIQQATARYMKRVSGNMADMYRPTRDGDRLIIFGGERDEQSQQMQQIAVIGILVALILPAVQAAREAARRTQSANNLKQLILALLNYEDQHGHFPPHANYSPDGKPLLSWRVHILPFIEEQALYEQFHLDEPWDSEHNRQLIDQMPEFFADPSSPLAMVEHRSSYVAPYGEGLFMEGKEGTRLRQFLDGTSNTIALVEVDDARAPIWTQPDDIAIDVNDPAAGLGGKHPGIFLAVYTDGHVEFVAQDIDPRVLSAELTRAGGEVAQR